jgi:spore coat protein C
MRCTKLVLTVVGLMIVMLVALAAPAIADDGRRDGKQHDDKKKFFKDHGKKFFDHDFVEVDVDFDKRFFDHDKKFFDHDKKFFDHDFVEVDVDFKKVGRHSAWVGNCFVTDIDGNRFIDDWEVEITCFVPRRW